MGKKRVIKEEAETDALKAANPAEKISEGASPQSKKARKKPVSLPSARIYISASYNNTLISLTDAKGDSIAWSSAGAMGFKGPKKATPFAASRVVENIFEKLGNIDLGKVSIYVRGVGSGRDAAVRALVGRGINIVSLEDKTPVPHNGCRPRKARRV